MSLCINPGCPQPKNPDHERFCLSCGSELLLQGRYRVIRRLGGGGFGITYEVSDAHSNTTKVLKVLINSLQKAVELFQQEAQVLTSLNHPGIPKVESDGYFVYFPRNSQDPIHCLVMEKIVGIDLQKWMENRGMSPIDQDLAMQWLRELVSILQQVHAQNFFHRDIKPPNIMLRADGNLTLIDFGTARQLTETYEIKVAAGQKVTGIISAGYTPSEQINGHAEPRSDFFALGRTFVYLVTGKHPLDPEIYDSQNDQVRWGNHAAHISPLLVDLLELMMASKPTQRPANTQIILRQLAEIELALQSGRYTLKSPLFRPGMQFPQTEEKFFRRWVIANTVGGTLCNILVSVVLFDSSNSVYLYPITAGSYSNSPLVVLIVTVIVALIVGFIVGAGFGTIQWLVLRQWFYRTRWWILATAVDAAMSSIVLTVINVKLYSSLPFVAITPAPLLGIMQSFVLRKFLPKVSWWILATPLCMITGFALAGFVSSVLTLLSSTYHISLPLAISIVTVFVGFFMFSMLTGALLIWLLRRSRSN